LKGNPCGCPNEAARVAPTGKREKRWVTVKITPKKVTPTRVTPTRVIPTRVTPTRVTPTKKYFYF
jgi:hypothetical protein